MLLLLLLQLLLLLRRRLSGVRAVRCCCLRTRGDDFMGATGAMLNIPEYFRNRRMSVSFFLRSMVKLQPFCISASASTLTQVAMLFLCIHSDSRKYNKMRHCDLTKSAQFQPQNVLEIVER